jgi:hypothetical protein
LERYILFTKMQLRHYYSNILHKDLNSFF